MKERVGQRMWSNFKEHRAASEKDDEGWAESERPRGIQRYPVWHVSSVREVQKQGQDTRLLVKGLIPSLLTPSPNLRSQRIAQVMSYLCLSAPCPSRILAITIL